MRVPALVLVIIVIGILGCSRESATPTPPPTSTSIPPTATATDAPALPTPTPTPEPFFLLVTEPVGDSIVNSSSVTVTGSTTPDAVVSINGESTEVDIDGAFSAEVILEEGPNSVEVVASNLQGDQESVILALIYLP